MPGSVQAALRALSGSAFFAGLAERAMLFDLQQVRRYMTDPVMRRAVQDRVAAAVDEDTRVVVGHSLGSVVAYEALCAHPEWPVRALVTLGSPLGIRNLIFDRLVPAPAAGESGKPAGAWPGGVQAWMNVADAGDVVALVKDLRPLFGAEVACYLVDNGSHAHDVRPYLTAAETGAAIAAGLAHAAAGNDRRRGAGARPSAAAGGGSCSPAWSAAITTSRRGTGRNSPRTCSAWWGCLPGSWGTSMCR